ncbi:MAG: tRNA 5-methoxyuridine(34)/uridine 5-oxyacetic acid(34) synthase CmoB [Spirochaetia bacterium]|nr:tRNA 5-methoxyuridine(34)/uridine 5-oxyacetic acid(34) synthase CmoB [Spirochaetia bacterium]
MIENSLDYLKSYLSQTNLEALGQILKQKYDKIKDNRYKVFIDALNNLSLLKTAVKDYKNSVVKIGSKDELSPKAAENLYKLLKLFVPWRKGPFSLFGIDIDAEWRSDLKWERFLPFIDDMRDKTICDIGANSGYYMFRAAHYSPKLVLGVDPTIRFWLTFKFLQSYANEKSLYYEPFGFEELNYFNEFFDIIFCMGIVYHHKDPLDALKKSFDALKPGGQILVESLGYDSADSIAFFPGKKYAGVSGVWFVPSETCLENWLIRAGFSDVQCRYNLLMEEKEQRETKWAPGKSFIDFIDKKDSSKTTEGFLRPRRLYFTARKKKN